MEIRATEPARVRFAAASSAAPGGDDPRQLAVDLVQSGVRLETPRRLPLWREAHRAAEPEEVGRLLARGREVRIFMPGVPIPLPVLSPEDLREAAVFCDLRPVEELPRPELARDLQQLSGAGWKLRDLQDQEIGTYGAYNALTGSEVVRAERERLQVRLETPERAHALREYYQPGRLGPRARLEEAGYQFFDANGNAGAAFDLEGGPGVRLGRGVPWLEVDCARPLDERVGAFEPLIEQLGRPDLARAYWAHTSEGTRVPDRAAWEGLLKGRDPEQRSRLAPLAARDLAGSGPDAFCAAGIELIHWNEPALRDAWLAELEKQPDCAENARRARALCRRVEQEETRWALWKAALLVPRGTDRDYASRVLELLNSIKDNRYAGRDSDEKRLGQGLLAELKGPMAAALSAWKPTDALASVRSVLNQPAGYRPTAAELSRMGTENIAWDNQDAHRGVLADLRRDPATRGLAELCERLHEGVQGAQTRWAVWKACAIAPEGDDLTAMAGRLYANLDTIKGLDYPERQADQQRLGQMLLEEFSRRPDTRVAAEALNRWGIEDAAGAVGTLLKHPSARSPEELGNLAAEAIGWRDEAAHRKVFAELGGCPRAEAALRLHDAVHAPQTRWAVWKAFVTQPGQAGETDGVAALATRIHANLDQIKEVTYSEREEDLKRLKQATLMELATSGQKLESAAALRRWGASDVDLSLKAALASPRAQTPAELGRLAAEGIGWRDEAAHNAMLDELARLPECAALAESTRRLCVQVKGAEARWAVWKAFALSPQGSSGRDVVALGNRIYENLDSISNVTWDSREDDLDRIARGLVTELLGFPDTIAAARAVQGWGGRNSTLAAHSLLANAGETDPIRLAAVAADGIAWDDRAAHDRVLRELARHPDTRMLAQVAARLSERVQGGQTRWAVWKACVLAPTGQGTAALKDYQKRVLELMASISGVYYAERDADMAYLQGDLMNEIEVRALVEGSKLAENRLAEQEDRVLVGGVVVPKREDALAEGVVPRGGAAGPDPEGPPQGSASA